VDKAEIRLIQGYKAARCCSPFPPAPISGYYSYNNLIVIHRSECKNLLKVDRERLLSLCWDEILGEKEYEPEEDYQRMDGLDFRILKHHQEMGIDYSLMVASVLKVDSSEVFCRHRMLQDLKLLKRVKKVMVRYRKNLVDNKWIKHRNHTYYEITLKGKRYLDYFVSRPNKPD
jgi:hypothetical protein